MKKNGLLANGFIHVLLNVSQSEMSLILSVGGGGGVKILLLLGGEVGVNKNDPFQVLGRENRRSTELFNFLCDILRPIHPVYSQDFN